MQDIVAARFISDYWGYHAQNNPHGLAILHWQTDENHHRWTWQNLYKTAEDFSALMGSHGIGENDIVALIIRHNPLFYPIYIGVSLAGAIPTVLAYPNSRLHPQKLQDGLRGMAEKSGLHWILTEKDLEPIIRPLLQHPKSTIRGVDFPLEWKASASTRTQSKHRQTSSDICILQHSSGTTGLQKGIALSHQAVLNQIRSYHERLKLSQNDKIVSWLPLYHDMGLIAAFHMPLVLGLTTIMIDPFEWVSSPEILFDAITREKATITWLPNFAYSFMASHVHDDDLNRFDLSSMRLWINCSEVVRQKSHQDFLARFSTIGVSANTLSSCYAMAENTFAITQAQPGQQPARLTMQNTQSGQTTAYVSSGSPIKGTSVSIVNDKHEELGERQIGEIEIRSDCLFSGYENQPALTECAFHDGWFRTGDLGFHHGGEYFIVGRKKDTIIVAGNNIHPEDIEEEINGVAGVLRGRVVAFGLEDETLGTERIVVIAETDASPSTHGQLRESIEQALMQIDLTVRDIILCAPRSLIKSSSGKISRAENKKLFVEGRLCNAASF